MLARARAFWVGGVWVGILVGRYDHAGQQYVEYEGAGIALFTQARPPAPVEPAD